MEYIRYTETIRQHLIRKGYKYVQWGARLGNGEIGDCAQPATASFELLLHREKVGTRRKVYEIDGEKACGETNLPQVHFYVKLPD